MKRKIEELEALARNMVGDGKTPHVFFVSQFPVGAMMITREFMPAYRYWKSLPRTVETTLEGRFYGVICSTEPFEDNSTKLRTYDDSLDFLEQYPSQKERIN